MTDEQTPDQTPEPVTFDPADPPRPEDLPPLPPGMKWELTITAETEVIRADGTVER